MAARRWLPIVAGIGIFVVIVGLGLVGSCVYMLTRQVSVQTMSRSDGAQEFDKLRARFAGQQAFVELPDEDSDAIPVVHRELSTHPTGQISVVHVRVWVPRDGKLVRVDLPMWMLRLTGSKPITIETDHGAFSRMSLKVTAEDIDRRGPGLLVDHASRRGERVLAWTE